MMDQVFGVFAPDPAESPLAELALSLVPLDFVSEWQRCGDTADYLAHFFAHGYEDRDTVVSVLSTVLNELIENVVKFTEDKRAVGKVQVRQYSDFIRIDVVNQASTEGATAFGLVLEQLSGADPEALFIERVSSPPTRGGPGIGLIMLRKDYGVEIGARMMSTGDSVRVELQGVIPNDHMEQ